VKETNPVTELQPLKFTDSVNNIEFQLQGDNAPQEIIRLDSKGFHYRGQLIEDAGEAHRLMVEFLKQQTQPEPRWSGPLPQLVTSPTAIRPVDRYELGDAIRRAWLKHGRDSWFAIADEVFAALAKPEPVAPTDEELTLVYAYAVAAAVDNKRGPFKTEDAEAAQLAGLRAVLARWGTPANNTRGTQYDG
jgi:hypothetical protein